MNWLLASLLCASSGDSTLVMSRDRTIRQFHHTAWTAKDGAPSQIGVLAQTQDGYLWIGTARGLFRFDGMRFEQYKALDGGTLPSHNIHALMATADGGLWISSRNYGLGYLKNGRMTVFTGPDDIPKGWVSAFAADEDGRVWAGTSEGLALRSGSRWLEIGTDWHVERGRVSGMVVDRRGTLWAAIGNRVWCLPRGSQTFKDSGIRPATGVTALAEAPNGDIWLADRLRSLRPVGMGEDTARWLTTGVRLDAYNMLFARDGALWAVGGTDGLLRMRLHEKAHRPLERFRESDGLSGNLPFALLEDLEGTIWVGTNKGLDRFRSTNIVPVILPPAVGDVTLLAGEHGDVWAGSTSGNSLMHVREDHVVVRRAPAAASVFREPGGDAWWGGYGAIWRQRGERIDLFPLPPEIPTDWVLEVISSDDDALWIRVLGTLGLVHFKDGVWSRRPPPQGLLARGPSATYHDSQRRIWFGYGTGRVDLLDDGRVTVYGRNDGLDIGSIKVIRGQGPAYWFGGESGLAMFRDGRFRSVLTDSGKPFETVSGIIATADGTLWLNELRGIIRIPASEVRNILGNPDHRATYQLFDYADGLPGAPQMNFTVSTAVEATDGRLWFATDNGLARIDPADLQTNRVPPPVSILSPEPNARFPSGTKSIQLRYTALSLSRPERVQFRYQLEGVDEQWQQAGARREAFYTNLRPGKYTFHVIAANHDGVWNEAGSTLAFEIPPAFSQTRWFTLVAVALVFGFLWLAYRFRLRRMAARMHQLHEERLDERTRIASELHDTLLQGFTGVTLEIQGVLQRTRTDTAPEAADLSRALTLADATLREARERIWDLRAPVLDGHDLATALEGTARDALRGTNIELRLAVLGARRPLPAAIDSAAMRIVREAVVNARKHARPEVVDIELLYEMSSIRLIVRDDGAGFAAQEAEGAAGGHWGILGMRERAVRAGGKVEITSEPGRGATIAVWLPAPAA